MTLSSVIFNI